MTKKSEILRIVKEDILRILTEEQNKKTSLESIRPEIKTSDIFVLKAIEELKTEKLIREKEQVLELTEKGIDVSKNILKRHLILENYFKETRSGEEAHRAAHILEHYISEEVIDNIKKLSTLREEDFPLLNLNVNEESMITDITLPDYKLFERIVSMGISLGEKIKITNIIHSGFIVRIKNKKIALDKDIIKEIKIHS
jgi:Mn-dependent DtxR family transcriptional regulator